MVGRNVAVVMLLLCLQVGARAPGRRMSEDADTYADEWREDDWDDWVDDGSFDDFNFDAERFVCTPQCTVPPKD